MIRRIFLYYLLEILKNHLSNKQMQATRWQTKRCLQVQSTRFTRGVCKDIKEWWMESWQCSDLPPKLCSSSARSWRKVANRKPPWYRRPIWVTLENMKYTALEKSVAMEFFSSSKLYFHFFPQLHVEFVVFKKELCIFLSDATKSCYTCLFRNSKETKVQVLFLIGIVFWQS